MNSISNIKFELGLVAPPIQTVELSGLLTKSSVDVLRTDLIHPIISGNKFYKLCYYLQAFYQKSYQGIVSFGGPFSNHLVATAAVCKELKIPFIAVIRGEAPTVWSDTLLELQAFNSNIEFVNRAEFPKSDADYLYWQQQFPSHYLIPMGGEGALGFKGASLIADELNIQDYDEVFVPIGTGTTMAGLLTKLASPQTIHGVVALKIPDPQNNSILKLIESFHPNPNQYNLIYDYHFGGFGKANPSLWNYMNDLYHRTGIETDQVYTAKMFYAVEDLLNKKILSPDKKRLLIHTGGLQGNRSIANNILNF